MIASESRNSQRNATRLFIRQPPSMVRDLRTRCGQKLVLSPVWRK